jgi:hypothetical protein
MLEAVIPGTTNDALLDLLQKRRRAHATLGIRGKIGPIAAVGGIPYMECAAHPSHPVI